MFGWLKKRFGTVNVDGQAYTYKMLRSLEGTELLRLGSRAATTGQDTAVRWAVDALMEAPPQLEPCRTVILAGNEQLAPAVLADLHATLASGVTGECAPDVRVQIFSDQLTLAKRFIAQHAMVPARVILEKALPALANVSPVPGVLGTLLIDAARLAWDQHWQSAVLGLLDRKLAFNQADHTERADLLVAAALGSTDRAVSQLTHSIGERPDDIEAHYLLGQAHAKRAKKAGSDKDFADERGKALVHLESARRLAGEQGSSLGSFSGVVLGAGSALALLALMAPAYDEILYLDGPLKGAVSAGGSAPSE